MIGDILQPSHLLFILVIALIVLGPKKLPEVGRALGRGLRDFRSALSDADPRQELAEVHQLTDPAAAVPPIAEPTPAAAEPMPDLAAAPEPAATAARPPAPTESATSGQPTAASPEAPVQPATAGAPADTPGAPPDPHAG